MLTSLTLVIGCRKEPAKTPKVFPSDGYAQVSFVGRSFDVFSVFRSTITTPASEERFIHIHGILDAKDSLGLVIPAPPDSIPPSLLYFDSIFVGLLYDRDLIYGGYKIITQDSYVDSISYDSSNTSYSFYSVQFNLINDFTFPEPDSLWFQGRIFMKND